MCLRTKTASLSSRTTCYEVRNCHLRIWREKVRARLFKMAQKMQAYHSIPKYHWNPNPNVERKSNAIIFLPNTNLNNVRAMALILVYFFSKTEYVQSKITDGWYGHGHFFVRMSFLSVLPIFSASASCIWGNWSLGVGEIAPHISICQWS